MSGQVSDLSEYGQRLLRATRVVTKALGGAIFEARPGLVERYGEDIAMKAIVGAVCLNAHAAAKLALGESLDDLTDETVLTMVRELGSEKGTQHGS